MLPFIDEHHPDYFIRTFDSSLDCEHFYWHKDKKDRIILATSGKDWKIQMDNQLPEELSSTNNYFIPKETYHRIIKGTDDLVLKIKELD